MAFAPTPTLLMVDVTVFDTVEITETVPEWVPSP